ncbi:Fe-S protein assembly co-chaperone HscB [bacterium]|nr:Fe-S protein assembly co-chaperone HscB [bacterium]
MNCWNCNEKKSSNEHFCSVCKKIQPLEPNQNFFDFLGLDKTLLNQNDLRIKFIRLSREFHPDFFQNETELEKEASLSRSTFLNKAYQILKDDFKRAKYLISVFAPEISQKKVVQTQVKLLEFMETKEEIEEAKANQNQQKLNEIFSELREKEQSLAKKLSELFSGYDTSNLEKQHEILERMNLVVHERNYFARLLGEAEE